MCALYHERMHADDSHWDPVSQKMRRQYLQRRTRWLSAPDSSKFYQELFSAVCSLASMVLNITLVFTDQFLQLA
jgi:hypothetical protein